MVPMREAHRRGSSQNVDSEQLGATLNRKGILQRSDIQRWRIELVGKIRVVLVVGFAVDVDFAEVFERGSNAEEPETQLEQNEEEQGDYENRNEREGNFLDEISPGVCTESQALTVGQ